MSTALVETIKEQLVQLTKEEQAELIQFLTEQMKPKPQNAPLKSEAELEAAEIRRNQQMEWLKTNRETYAGQYVALEGNRLVGTGKTMKEAHEEAKRNGVPSPFLLRVTSEHEVLWGGW